MRNFLKRKLNISSRQVVLPPGPAWLACAAAVLALLVMASLVEHMYRVEGLRVADSRHSETLQQASSLRSRLEAELNASLYTAAGLVGYVVAHQDFLDSERVATALETIHRNGRHLRNVALAPDNVLTYVYPVAGNEAAIGLNYERHPEQWRQVERAMTQGHSVLVGPMPLVQGGYGLVNRTPVFLADGRYWGLLSVVIDPDSLFGMFPTEDKAALRWLDARDSDLDGIWGDQALFEREPVTLNIQVPDGVWQLGMEPSREWAAAEARLGWYRFAGHLVAVLVAGLLLLVLLERRHIALLAWTDQLTGLPNRRMFQHRLERLLQESRRRQQAFLLYYIDLDGFKAVNDRMGHAQGDRVLSILAGRMRSALDEACMLARIGGDEFALLRPDCGDVATAERDVDALLAAVRKPVSGLPTGFRLDATVGVARFPDDGDSAGQLVQHADSRMYQAKSAVSGNR